MRIRTAAVSVGFIAATATSHAQLAAAFYNVVGLQTTRLPNAVQVVIRTNGVVSFGCDMADFASSVPGVWAPKPTQSFRVRMINARAALPALQNIGAYPLDCAAVTLGDTEFQRPVFDWDTYDPGAPRLDVEFRFYVPVRVKRVITARVTRSSFRDAEPEGVVFGELEEPLDVEVAIGTDRRSVLITMLTDRVDGFGARRIDRSPLQSRKSTLEVRRSQAGRYDVRALNARLTDLLDKLSEVGMACTVVKAKLEPVTVSLNLPDATEAEIERALLRGLALNRSHTPDGALEGDGSSREPVRLPLNHVDPVRARALLPDALLTSVRPDSTGNALVLSDIGGLQERLRSDIALLDRPTALLRVAASIWEVSATKGLLSDLSAVLPRPSISVQGSAAVGDLVVHLADQEQRHIEAKLASLSARGAARLLGRPNVVVKSGEVASLFLGQQRYVTILRTTWRGQVAQALKLSVGISLTARPSIGADGAILLEATPSATTVDEIESTTGLPTLGVRFLDTACLLSGSRPAVLAGLDLSAGQVRRRTAGAYRRQDSAASRLLFVITVQEEE